MAVPIKGDAALEIGIPAALFEARFSGTRGFVSFSTRQEYAVTADRQRFLLNVTLPEPIHITVVLNWTAGLKKSLNFATRPPGPFRWSARQQAPTDDACPVWVPMP